MEQAAQAESLIDVEDVGLGHRTRLAWNPRDQWVFSDQQVHAELISRETFEQVRARLASRGPRSTGRVTERKKHPYALKGLLFHESCGRRMQGNWIRERAHYRCRYPNEYALANRLDHPLTVHLREDVLLEPLDTWLAQVFAPGKIERSLSAMEESQPDHAPGSAETRRALAECDRKLARHQAALEAGTDPALVAKWTRQVQREKAVLEAQLAASDARMGADRRMTAAEIRQLVDAMGGLLQVLRDADPGDKLEVYRQLGLKLTYNETTRMVVAETQPQPSVCAVVVSEGGVAH